MPKHETEHRRLASIMFIDMVGYSALVQRTESLALELLEEYRKTVRSHLEFFEGIEIQTVGDGFLIRFPSALAAVHAAIAIQQSFGKRNTEVPSARNFRARIGIHLGDVVEREDGDVFGDGVNIAARVEPIAEPGGICLTQQVFDQVQHRLADQIVPIGSVALKNISPPLNLFRIAPPGAVAKSAHPAIRFAKQLRSSFNSRWAAAAALVLAIAVLAREGYQKWSWTRAMPAQRQIVVMPFDVIGNSKESAAFSDGLVETVAGKLTQMQGAAQTCFVIPPSEAREARIRNIGDASRIGATLVLFGQIQREKDLMRVTVSLVETATRRQLRSEVIDTTLEGLYGLQDRIAYKTGEWLGLEAVAPVQKSQIGPVAVKGELYESYLQGMGQLTRWDRDESLNLALGNFGRASRVAGFAPPIAGQAEVYFLMFRLSHQREFLEMAQKFCVDALSVDTNLVPALVTRSAILSETGNLDLAIEDLKRALALEPGNYQGWLKLAYTTERKGRFDEAQQLFKRAINLGPHYWGGYSEYARFHVRRGRYEDALKLYQKALELTPDNAIIYRNIGGTYSYMGRYDEAIVACKKSIQAYATPEAYSNLATIYCNQQQYTNAAEMFEEAIKRKTPTAVVLGNLADAYRYINRSDDARRKYREAINLALRELEAVPGDDLLRSSLALYYASIGDKEPAIREITAALEKGSGNVNVIFNSVVVYELLGERKRALVALEKAIRDNYSLSDIAVHPDLAKLRDDPEYKQLLTNKPQKNP